MIIQAVHYLKTSLEEVTQKILSQGEVIKIIREVVLILGIGSLLSRVITVQVYILSNLAFIVIIIMHIPVVIIIFIITIHAVSLSKTL